MDDAKNSKIQEQKKIDKEKQIKAQNEFIMKENMQKLEKCIQENMNFDQAKLYNKTFKCEGFTFLIEQDEQDNHTTFEDSKKTAENYLPCMFSIGVLYNSNQDEHSKLLPNTYRIIPNIYTYRIEINMTNKV